MRVRVVFVVLAIGFAGCDKKSSSSEPSSSSSANPATASKKTTPATTPKPKPSTPTTPKSSKPAAVELPLDLVLAVSRVMPKDSPRLHIAMVGSHKLVYSGPPQAIDGTTGDGEPAWGARRELDETKLPVIVSRLKGQRFAVFGKDSVKPACVVQVHSFNVLRVPHRGAYDERIGKLYKAKKRKELAAALWSRPNSASMIEAQFKPVGKACSKPLWARPVKAAPPRRHKVFNKIDHKLVTSLTKFFVKHAKAKRTSAESKRLENFSALENLESTQWNVAGVGSVHLAYPSGVWGFAIIAVDSDRKFRQLGMLDTGSVETNGGMATPNVSIHEVDIDADGKLDVVFGLHSGATLVVFHRGGHVGWWRPVGPKVKP